MQSINITCTIETLEDFHIGTGMGNIGLYDDGQQKDEQGRPTLNSSTLKGLLRDSCAALNRAKILMEEPDNKELYNKLFVHFDNLSSLDIDIQPVLTPDSSRANTIIHYFTAVDHGKRKAKEGTLRSLEFGAKGQMFRVEIRYLNRGDDSKQLCEYIQNGLKNIKAIGGHRRRGFGAIAISNLKTKIDVLSPQELSKPAGKKLELIFQLNEDTIISSKAQSGNMLSTNDYIPGTTILGMLRSILLSQGQPKTYLDDGQVAASFFYPRPQDCPPEAEIEICPAFMSIRKKKSYLTASSFDAGSKLGMLPSWALNQDSDNRLSSLISRNTMQDSDEHSDQGKGVYEGYIYRNKTDASWTDARYYKASKQYHQRNSIDSHSQSTKKGGIFIEQKLKRGTMFLGNLSFASEEACSEFIKDFSPWLRQENRQALHIGRGGKAMYVVQYRPVADSPDPSVVLDKDQSFNISLLSDAILYDNQLLPCTTITSDTLAMLLGEGYKPKEFVLQSFVSRSGVISAFSGTSGLRKFRDLAIRKGSCYRFKYIGANTTALEKRLTELIQTGIGFRKSEGFGSIAINHAVHDIKAQTTSTTSPIKVCQEVIDDIEMKRLSDKTAMYSKAEQLKQQMNEFIPKIENKQWISMAANTLVQIESGVDWDRLKKNFQGKMDDKTEGHWGKEDTRHKIAQKLIDEIDQGTTRETIATALKLLLKGKGEGK